MIRPAKFGDVDALCDLLEWGHGESIYATMFPFERAGTKKFLMWALHHMGTKTKSAFPTLFWVAETDGIVCGIMLATLQPIYHIGIKLQASDIFWIGRAGICDHRDMSALFTRFITWAEEDERVWEIKVSTSDAVMSGKNGQPSWRDMAPMFQRRGFEPCGELFVRRLQR